MRHYKNKIDALFGVLLLLGTLLALLLLLTAFDVTVFWRNPEFARLMIPFALMLGAFIVSRVQLLRADVRWWAYLSMLLTTCWAAAAFNALPLHDIFLYFGSHGRFGCQALNEVAQGEYRHIYFFRDQTAPFILFGPILLGVFLHWVRTPRARQVLFHEQLFTRRDKAAEPGAPPSGRLPTHGDNSGPAEGPHR